MYTSSARANRLRTPLSHPSVFRRRRRRRLSVIFCQGPVVLLRNDVLGDNGYPIDDRLAVKLAARPQGELELISYYRS